MSNLSKFASKARTHEEARAVVCCVCGRKVVARKGGFPCVSDRLANLVCKYVYENFSVQNSYHPTAICGTCRVTLGASVVLLGGSWVLPGWSWVILGAFWVALGASWVSCR